MRFHSQAFPHPCGFELELIRVENRSDQEVRGARWDRLYHAFQLLRGGQATVCGHRRTEECGDGIRESRGTQDGCSRGEESIAECRASFRNCSQRKAQ